MKLNEPNPSQPMVVIVLPAYNAARTLLKTLAEIPQEYAKHVILVDDGSQDNTVEIAREAGLTVVLHEKNMGYGANQKTCYRTALAMGADIVVMVHPDHQYDATVIPEMVRPMLLGRADAVFGSRMLGGSPMKGGMPWWKYDANIVLTGLANIVFQRYLTEIHSGFRSYSRLYLETVQYEKNSDDFIFDTEIIAEGMACNLYFQEVPITTRYFKEASSINFQRSVKYGLEILLVLAKYILHKKRLLRFAQFEPKSEESQTGRRAIPTGLPEE